MTGSSLRSRRAGYDDRLDAVVELRREDVVALGDVLEGNLVGDDVARLEVAVADVLEQPRPLPLDRALVHPQGEALVHGISELDRREQRAVGTDNRDCPAL